MPHADTGLGGVLLDKVAMIHHAKQPSTAAVGLIW
jgi:hypothetical protein